MKLNSPCYICILIIVTRQLKYISATKHCSNEMHSSIKKRNPLNFIQSKLEKNSDKQKNLHRDDLFGRNCRSYVERLRLICLFQHLFIWVWFFLCHHGQFSWDVFVMHIAVGMIQSVCMKWMSVDFRMILDMIEFQVKQVSG